ncbi:MAG: arginine deiminase family protein [Bacteroidetes bacterium]|jgi:N-dimethylarginine dimethylaminohydrolase|nr:arginine deiminase family protein [Bacteroidota bacterium]
MSAHSESGKLSSLFIKKAAAAFIDDAHVSKHWEALNYLGKPAIDKALAEYEAFEKILKEHGAEIFYFPEDDSVNMDSIYCRDASIATSKGMIICTMGKEGRKNEPIAQKKAFEDNGIPVLGVITAPGTIEGGDVAWLDAKTLAVGHTYRTNEEGIRQITALLKPLGVDVITVPMPHYRGSSDVFHLMSVLSPVADNLAVVYSPLIPIVFRNELIKRGFELVEVPEAEFDSMGCNVLALAPRTCLMVKGNPITKSRLEAAGCKVIEYEGAEISVKGGGGPTCLTRPISRA